MNENEKEEVAHIEEEVHNETIFDEKSESAQEENQEELVVSIGDEPEKEEEQRAPDWVREVRKNNRELQKRNRELEEQVKAINTPKSEIKKPTLEDCEYDADVYDQKLEEWFQHKQKAEAAQRKKQEEEQNAQAEWNSRIENYEREKKQLNIPNIDEIEEDLKHIFSKTQQGIIIDAAKRPAFVMAALGGNHKRAKELASINNHVRFAAEIGALEKDLKVTKKTAPPPEKVVSGNAPKSGTVDSTLKSLREEAEKTGNYTKVAQYKRQKRI